MDLPSGVKFVILAPYGRIEQVRTNRKPQLPYAFGITLLLLLACASSALAQVKPGDLITKDNAAKVQDLVSPGNYVLVQNGMQIHVIASDKLEWPPPYKTASEKYSAQVSLTPDGEIKGYVAGQPFPLLDPNDPEMALKVMWNFSFRPLYTDDADLRFAEIASYSPHAAGSPVSYFTVGHFAFYNNIGRIEVAPVPTDPDAQASGIRFRFGYYPLLEPSSLRGYGMIRFRHIDGATDDNTWVFNPETRRIRRESAQMLSDAISALPGFSSSGFGVGSSGTPAEVTTIDPDSYFGFSAKIEDYSYKFLGEKSMLASVHAKNSPEVPCPTDGGKTICPEDWEIRRLYAVEATARPGHNLSIPKRVLYIDSEGWFITASDQYDRDGKLWKTLVAFNTYRDRPVPDARVAIYPYKRMFQVGLVDYDVQLGYSSVIYMPGRETEERECWYIDMGVVDNQFFTPQALTNAGH
jgi:hypothetical protein